MLWNRFDLDRKKLNLYDNPHFEPGSGIRSRDAIVFEITRMLDEMSGQPHPIIKARAFAFALDHAAIEVNPIDWFGWNICGWLTPKGEEKLRKQHEAFLGVHANSTVSDDDAVHTVMVHRSPLAPLNVRWCAEIQPTPEFEAAAANIAETGAESRPLKDPLRLGVGVVAAEALEVNRSANHRLVNLLGQLAFRLQFDVQHHGADQVFKQGHLLRLQPAGAEEGFGRFNEVDLLRIFNVLMQ